MRALTALLLVAFATGCIDSPTPLDAEPLPFDDGQLRGLCEDMIADFADGEPSPSQTEKEAAAQFVAEHSILEGLDVQEGKIFHRGEQVGSYRIVKRPGETFSVESAEWCYPAG